MFRLLSFYDRKKAIWSKKKKNNNISQLHFVLFLKSNRFKQNPGKYRDAPLSESVLGSSKLAESLKAFHQIHYLAVMF